MNKIKVYKGWNLFSISCDGNLELNNNIIPNSLYVYDNGVYKLISNTKIICNICYWIKCTDEGFIYINSTKNTKITELEKEKIKNTRLEIELKKEKVKITGLETDSEEKKTKVTGLENKIAELENKISNQDLNTNQDNDYFRKIFNNLYLIYKDSCNLSWKDNDNGRFSWDDTYVIDSCIKMYTITKDNYYIEIAYKLCMKFIDNTDKKRNIVDKFFGKDQPNNTLSYDIWSSNRYTKYNIDAFNKQFGTNIESDNVYHCHLILGSNIVHKLLLLSFIIRKYKIVEYINDTDIFVKISKNYLDILLEYNWIDEGESGYIYDPFVVYWAERRGIKKNIPDVMPFNRYAMTGRCLILLYKITNNDIYLNYTKKIYFKIMNHIKNNPKSTNNVYIWDYAPNLPTYPEDISHATITIDFMLDCYYNILNLVNIEDIKKFKNIFFENVNLGDNKFSFCIDGSKGVTKHSNAVSRWLPLNIFCENNELYEVVKKHYYSKDFINESMGIYKSSDDNEYFHIGAYFIQYYVNLIYYDPKKNNIFI